jgi:cytoplasmic iron level regulating protein YaaA (DUF328/UPF0246 family)
MLILVPASETKRPSPAAGPPLELGALSFPELTPTREQVLDALIATSAGPDAFERLFERPSMAGQIERNTRLRVSATRAAGKVYAGPLHDGLALDELGPAASARGDRCVVITSPLWGALRPADRIPSYRMRVWARLVGLDRVEPRWRRVLPDLFSELAGTGGLIFDLRPGSHQSLGMPIRDLDRTVSIHVDSRSDEGQRIGDVIAKRVRGQAAHLVLDSGEEPAEPDRLADLLADRWRVRLSEPEGRTKPWTVRLTVDAGDLRREPTGRPTRPRPSAEAATADDD